MRILITGATGLLGTDLCRTLARCHEVIGWARRWRPVPVPEGMEVQGEPVDVARSDVVDQGIRRLKPDLVIHSAAMSDVDACERDPDLAWAVNAQAVGIVARACASVGAFLIAVSTDYVFGGSARRPYREEDAPSPVNLYGRVKWEGEQLALKECERCLVVRVSGLFGSARPNFALSTAKRFREGQKVPVVTDQVNSPSFTKDLAEAVAELIDRFEQEPTCAESGGRLHGILHLANSGGASRLEVAQRLAALLRTPTSLIEQTTWAQLSRPARRPTNSRLDCSRLARLMGKGLRMWDEALEAFLHLEGLG